MYKKHTIFSHQGGNPCSTILGCNKSSSVYLLMTFPMRSTIIFLPFVSITRKLQEEFVNKDPSSTKLYRKTYTITILLLAGTPASGGLTCLRFQSGLFACTLVSYWLIVSSACWCSNNRTSVLASTWMETVPCVARSLRKHHYWCFSSICWTTSMLRGRLLCWNLIRMCEVRSNWNPEIWNIIVCSADYRNHPSEVVYWSVEVSESFHHSFFKLLSLKQKQLWTEFSFGFPSWNKNQWDAQFAFNFPNEKPKTNRPYFHYCCFLTAVIQAV